MSSGWPVGVVYLLIWTACMLLIPDEVLSVARFLSKDREFPLWEWLDRAFGVIDLLSFGVLFGFGALFVTRDIHRFQEARDFFTLGVMVVAIRLSALSCNTIKAPWKWVVILVIIVIAVGGEQYLLGIVDAAQREFEADANARSIEQYKAERARHSLVAAPQGKQGAVDKYRNVDDERMIDRARALATELKRIARSWSVAIDEDKKQAYDVEDATSDQNKYNQAEAKRHANDSKAAEQARMNAKTIIREADEFRVALLDRIPKNERFGIPDENGGNRMFRQVTKSNYSVDDLEKYADYLDALANGLEAARQRPLPM